MSKFDDLAGGGLERAVHRHHRRRLRRLGQLDALDSSGSAGTELADNGRGYLLPVTVRAHDSGQIGALYVYAKVGIVDDRWLTIGSANCNEHSLFNYTEVNIASLDPALARGTRLRLWAEHLERTITAVHGQVSAWPQTGFNRSAAVAFGRSGGAMHRRRPPFLSRNGP